MKYIVLRSFIKKFDSYHKQEQEIISYTIEKTKEYLETNQAKAQKTFPEDIRSQDKHSFADSLLS